LGCGYTPVDLDTFAMNNSFTKRELVGRTYAGVHGYCQFAVYLGRLGYCLELALRPGMQHWTAESQYNFERALPITASLVCKVQCRRIRMVMQELMFKVARMIKHAGRCLLGLGQSDSGFAVFERHCGQLKTA